MKACRYCACGAKMTCEIKRITGYGCFSSAAELCDDWETMETDYCKCTIKEE